MPSVLVDRWKSCFVFAFVFPLPLPSSGFPLPFPLPWWISVCPCFRLCLCPLSEFVLCLCFCSLGCAVLSLSPNGRSWMASEPSVPGLHHQISLVLLSLLCRLFLCFRCPPFSLFDQRPPETVVQGWLCRVLYPLLLLRPYPPLLFRAQFFFQLLNRFPHTSSQPFPLTFGHRCHSVSKAQALQCECVISSFDAANDFVQQCLFPGFHLRIFHCFFQCSVLDLFCEL